MSCAFQSLPSFLYQIDTLNLKLNLAYSYALFWNVVTNNSKSIPTEYQLVYHYLSTTGTQKISQHEDNVPDTMEGLNMMTAGLNKLYI